MMGARSFRSGNATGRQGGFTLIEIVIFIVIISIMVVGLFSTFSKALLSTGELNNTKIAMQLARERMELILVQRRVLGFTAFTAATYDPCTSAPPSVMPPCTGNPVGFMVTPNYGPDWAADTNYRVITVSVTGLGLATLTALVADY